MVWRHETEPILTNQRAEMDIVVSVSVALHHHPMWVLSFHLKSYSYVGVQRMKRMSLKQPGKNIRDLHEYVSEFENG